MMLREVSIGGAATIKLKLKLCIDKDFMSSICHVAPNHAPYGDFLISCVARELNQRPDGQIGWLLSLLV